jgi:Icc-related predicted phosphoesterase
MRRFLICGGVHGRIENLEWLLKAARERRPDGILFAGEVLERRRTYEPTSTTYWGHTKSDTLFLQNFFDSLGRLGVFTAIIPGVSDAPLDKFLRIGMNAEIEYPRLHIVHATPIEEGDVAVVGLGVCITDYTSTDIGYYSQSLANFHLRSLRRTSKSRTALLLAEPPESWNGEFENHRMVNALMTTHHPGLCVLGRTGDRRGIERIADTLVINPGHLSDGSAAWFDWDRAPGEQVKFLDPQSMAGPVRPPTLEDGGGLQRRAGQVVGV